MPHIDMPVVYHTWGAMPTSCWVERPFYRHYRMICLTSSLIRKLYHFATDFDRMLLQLVDADIVNALFKYRVSFRHQTFLTETSELLLKW